jgi:hypothetical protein
MDRQRKAMEKLKAQDREFVLRSGFLREDIYTYLLKALGYRQEDVEVDPSVQVRTEKYCEACQVDFLVRLGGRAVLAIKCAPDALESRVRQALAFSRVAEAPYLIPLAVVADAERALVYDAETGQLRSEGLQTLPSRQEALKIAETLRPAGLSAERLRRERLILLAYNATRCTLPDTCPPEEAT